jgi:hypothetical protein
MADHRRSVMVDQITQHDQSGHRIERGTPRHIVAQVQVTNRISDGGEIPRNSHDSTMIEHQFDVNEFLEDSAEDFSKDARWVL